MAYPWNLTPDELLKAAQPDPAPEPEEDEGPPAAAGDDGHGPDDFDQHMQGLLRKLDVAKAGAACDYDEAREGLAGQHAAADETVQTLQARIASLSPRIDAFLNGKQRALTPGLARAALQYLEACAALHDALSARRLAFGATLPPGQQQPGTGVG